MDTKLVLGILSFMLSGCAGIGGFWMNGDPSVGENITPARNYWTLPGGNIQERSDHWIECGGLADGSYGSSVSIPSERKLSTREFFDIIGKERDEVRICMINKGYRYTGACQTATARTSSACRESTLDKFLPYPPSAVLKIK